MVLKNYFNTLDQEMLYEVAQAFNDFLAIMIRDG